MSVPPTIGNHVTQVNSLQSSLQKENQYAERHGFWSKMLIENGLGGSSFNLSGFNWSGAVEGVRRSHLRRQLIVLSGCTFFCVCVSQYQPENKTIHLPPCFTQLSISQRMCKENTSLNSPSIGISQFYSIFPGHFSRPYSTGELSVIQTFFIQ